MGANQKFLLLLAQHNVLVSRLGCSSEVDANAVASTVEQIVRLSPNLEYVEDRRTARLLLRFWATYLSDRGNTVPDIDIDIPSRQPLQLRVASQLTPITENRKEQTTESKIAHRRPRKAANVNHPREKGIVKWFNAAKGFGFIQRESGEDVFVHFSAISRSEVDALNEGAVVEFEVRRGPKGLQAQDIKLD